MEGQRDARCKEKIEWGDTSENGKVQCRDGKGRESGGGVEKFRVKGRGKNGEKQQIRKIEERTVREKEERRNTGKVKGG